MVLARYGANALKTSEDLLCQIPLVDDTFDYGMGRGQAGFRKLTCLFSPEGKVGADTVWCCRLARISHWEYRAELTLWHYSRRQSATVRLEELLSRVE